VRGKGRVRNADGSIACEGDWRLNAIANEGEVDILNVYFTGAVEPHENLYLALLSAAPTNSTTMMTMAELNLATELGYSRDIIAMVDWSAPSGTQPADVTAAVKTFGPNIKGADWIPFSHAALVTTESGTDGKFILFVPLSGATTIHNTQSFEYILTVAGA
jgi:hypothetical protein